jgi:cAMP-binding proteins - catabolite gene activator and regulatory subunit of cAMP-dependent protein kinases
MREQIRRPEIILLHKFDLVLRKLFSMGRLSDDEVRILSRSYCHRIAHDTDVFAEGDSVEDFLFLVQGWAFRYRLLDDGRRQVLNFLVPGDVVGPFAPTAQHFVAALTDVAVCRLPRRELACGTRYCPGLCAAIEALMVTEFDMLAERTVSLGRRNAKERVAHLLLELFERLKRVELVDGNSFEIPLTQEIIGDAVGLSVVHVNRTLRVLREEGLATVGFGRATIHDRTALIMVASSEDGSHLQREQLTGILPFHAGDPRPRAASYVTKAATQ